MSEATPDLGTSPKEAKGYAAIRQAIDCLEWSRHDEALVICESLLRGKPDFAEALYLMGLMSFELDEPIQAIKLIGKAHEADPNLMEAVEALAAIHAMLGQTHESLYYAKLGTILEPHSAVDNLLPERLGSFFRNIDQGSTDLYLLRAKRHLAAGEIDEAAADCETQLELTPGDPATLRVLAEACRASGQNSRAIAASHALLHGGSAEAKDLSDLALALDASGRQEEAEVCHSVAVEQAPSDATLHSRLLHNLERRPAIDLERLERERQKWQARHASDFPDRPTPNRAAWQGKRPLRVGYLSGSFLDNDLMRFFEPILRAHDKRQIEAYCYADGGRRDAVSERLMRSAHKWTDIHRIDDETVWQILQGDEIDIAVDLAGNGAGGRPLMLARKPAPVVASWLGAFHPISVPELDYFLTDEVAWPDANLDGPQNDQVFRLKPGLLAYHPVALMPEIAPSPVGQNGHITFGTQCDLSSIDSAAIAHWASALQRVPGSRLLICNVRGQDEASISRVLECVSHFGLRHACDVINHDDNFQGEFDFYCHIDIALDSNRPNGAIEVCRALWMGVPVLTVRGSRHASRLAASLLTLAGRADWVADDAAAFGECAYMLSRDVAELASLRQSLRSASAESDLGNLRKFVRGLETAYGEMYERYEASAGITQAKS